MEKQFAFYTLLTAGIFVRLFLISNASLSQWLQNRVEISTPLTSWNRVLEGIYLKQILESSSSYEGDLVHEIPIMLRFYEFCIRVFNKTNIKYLFVLIDCFNSILVYLIAQKAVEYLIKTEKSDREKGKYSKLIEAMNKDDLRKKQLEKFFISNKDSNVRDWSLIAFAIYLFNPYGCTSCAAMSTVLVHNLFLLCWFYFLLHDKYPIAFFFLALHSNITVYSVMLVIASINYILNKQILSNNQKQSNGTFSTIFQYLTIFIFYTSCIFMANLYLENFNLRFIECTYLFILKVPDLLPNMGLYWYFFTEMFDHFVSFFTYVFQLNALMYSIPLTIRLKDSPIVNIFLQISFLSVLKSYPSLGETGLYISLLPIFSYLFPLMRNVLVYSCMFLAATVLAPIMFYLWLGSGGGNANFYFAITLVYAIGQIFLLVDVLYAHLKREFIKQNGPEIPKDVQGEMSIFSLD
jgi:phosphatidylinositol glycan class U